MRGDRISAGIGVGTYFDEEGSDLRAWFRVIVRR